MTWPWGTQSRALCLAIWFLVYYLELSRSVLVNRTIDDQLGDSVTGALPIYEGPPVDGWERGSTCKGCGVQPDPSFAFQGTWHDATWHPGDPGEKIMTVNFDGSAVYVFIILANSVPFVTTLTSLSFTLDGEQVGNFRHSPTASTDYEYNVTAYANNSLANGQHTLTMQTAGNNATLILFDYIIYSVDETTPVTTSSPTSSRALPPSSHSSPTLSSSPIDPTSTTSTSIPTSTSTSGASGDGKDTKTIVGVLVGGIVFVALAIVLFLYWHKRRRNTISVIQILPNDVVIGGRYLDRRSESSYGGETTSGTWLTSSVPTGTYTSVLSHYDRSSVVPSTMMLSSSHWPESSSNMTDYAHSTIRAEPSEGVTSIYDLESQGPKNSAERRLDLPRRIEQMGLEVGPTIPTTLIDAGLGREVGNGPVALREQVVFLLDEVERLHAQQELIARSFGVSIEPPPYPSTERRRPSFSRT